jgi:hypothetical protein
MPHQIQCPRCRRVGLVRVEHVIRGHQFDKAHYCGACEHQWLVAEVAAPPNAPHSPLPKARTRIFRPKRPH